MTQILWSCTIVTVNPLGIESSDRDELLSDSSLIS